MDILSMALIIITAAAALAAVMIYGKTAIKRTSIKAISAFISKDKVVRNIVTDYDRYTMKPIEYVWTLTFAAAALFLIGYIFYRSALLAALLTPFSLFYPKIRTRQIIEKRKRELKMQFKDALQSLSSSLHAGKSVESAIKSAISDLLIQYDADSYIIKEFEIIIRKLDSNETIEKAFMDFAIRSKLEEIQGFAEVLEICKRTGGNLVAAIRSSTDVISEKIEVLNDINNILAQKKLEQKILSVMPIALILMLSISAKDFMEPVFTEAAGRITMTISILLFALAYFIAGKITNIEV